MPSKLISTKTSVIARPSEFSGIMPEPDSRAKIVRMKNWSMAGRERSLRGRGGIPSDMEERERNTVV